MTRAIFFTLSSLLLCLTFLTVLFTRTGPSELSIPYRTLIFFLIGLLCFLLVLTAELVRALLLRQPMILSRTLRRGGILGLLSVTLLYLSAERLFSLLNVIPLVLAGILIELYLSSRLLPQKRGQL